MQPTNSVFEECEHSGGFTNANVQFLQFSPVAKVHQSTAEDESVTERTSPKIRQIHGVERFAFADTDGLENTARNRLRCDGKGKCRFGALGKAAEFEREGVRGKEHLLRANWSQRSLQLQRTGKDSILHRTVFENQNPTAFSSPSKPAENFSWIDDAAWDFFYHAQFARIVPA